VVSVGVILAFSVGLSAGRRKKLHSRHSPE
jgi:hypothetical protein